MVEFGEFVKFGGVLVAKVPQITPSLHASAGLNAGRLVDGAKRFRLVTQSMCMR